MYSLYREGGEFIVTIPVSLILYIIYIALTVSLPQPSPCPT
jgi:hypothetical protein